MSKWVAAILAHRIVRDIHVTPDTPGMNHGDIIEFGKANTSENVNMQGLFRVVVDACPT